MNQEAQPTKMAESCLYFHGPGPEYDRPVTSYKISQVTSIVTAKCANSVCKDMPPESVARNRFTDLAQAFSNPGTKCRQIPAKEGSHYKLPQN